MKDVKCEICEGVDFYIYKYPLETFSLKKKILFGALRRYAVNTVKFFGRIIFTMFPNSWMSSTRKRIYGPYKRIQSFNEVFSTIVKLDKATRLFSNRNIAVCKNCDLGTVFPRITEAELVNYYKNDYWIMNLGEIEPAESNRTIITLKLLDEAVGLSKVKQAIEFGSASAHIARYIKSKINTIDFDIVDPGIIWKDVLKNEIRNAYNNTSEISIKYDLLVSSHALEHVSSIESYFIQFKNLLNDNGYLYFEIPNSEERELVFKENPDFHLPHTYFFTRKSFENIAKKYGFKIIFNKTFSRSYSERFSGKKHNIKSIDENPKGAYLRVLLQKVVK